MSSRAVFIYQLVDPRDETIRYVGKTYDPVRRLYNHIMGAGLKDTAKRRWTRELIEVDHKQPELQIIEETTEADGQSRERYWIAELRRQGHPLLNVHDGGDPSLGALDAKPKGRLGYRSPQRKRAALYLRLDDVAWAKTQTEGLSGMVRRLLAEAHEKAKGKQK